MSAPGWRWVSRTRARRAGVRRRRRMRVMGKFMGIVYEVRGKANHRDHRGKERTQRRATANAGVSPLRAARFGRDDGFVRSLRRVSRRSGFPAGMTSKKDKYGDSDSASQNDDLKQKANSGVENTEILTLRVRMTTLRGYARMTTVYWRGGDCMRGSGGDCMRWTKRALKRGRSRSGWTWTGWRGNWGRLAAVQLRVSP